MIETFLNNRLLTLYIIPFILGCLCVFSFQPYNFSLINFIILPIFFYLLVHIKKKSKSIYRKKPFKKNLFIFGTAFGFGFFLSSIYWIMNSLTFDDNFKILIPFGIILIPLFLSLFFSLLTLCIGPYLNLNIRSIILFSSGLAFSDYIRANVFSGFPWNLWAYSFSWSIEIIQILEKLGLFAFNLILITIFMIPAIFFLKINFSKKISYFLLLPLILFSFYIYGDHSINQNQQRVNSVDEKFYIKVISPNFKLEYGLNSKQIEKRLINLIKYSDPDKDIKTLFVWPEGVFSGYSYSEILGLKKIFSENFNKNHFILFGINKADNEKGALYNSLVIVNKDMEILKEYKKQKLVPFGEFLPFEKLLNKFGLKKITEGYESFARGKKQENIKIDELNILPLICYEIIFTKFIQHAHIDTNLVINISEDGWFGNSIGPHQHFAKAIYRSIEQNSYLIRSANKGVSAIINNKGKIIKKLNPSEAGNIELDVPLIRSKNKNKNDLIFFVLLITYIFIFNYYKENNEK